MQGPGFGPGPEDSHAAAEQLSPHLKHKTTKYVVSGSVISTAEKPCSCSKPAHLETGPQHIKRQSIKFIIFKEYVPLKTKAGLFLPAYSEFILIQIYNSFHTLGALFLAVLPS